MVKYLHTMVRVKDLEKSMAFYQVLGLVETRRIESEKGRFTLVFMAPPDQPAAGARKCNRHTSHGFIRCRSSASRWKAVT